MTIVLPPGVLPPGVPPPGVPAPGAPAPGVVGEPPVGSDPPSALIVPLASSPFFVPSGFPSVPPLPESLCLSKLTSEQAVIIKVRAMRVATFILNFPVDAIREPEIEYQIEASIAAANDRLHFSLVAVLIAFGKVGGVFKVDKGNASATQ